jgi:predicted dinucleotide-binding enzyme
MNFGILGTGMVGQAIAARLAGQGHAVMVGTRNVAETLARPMPAGMGDPPFSAWQKQNPQVKLGTFAEAAAHGEMIFNCTAGGVSLDALKMAGEANLNGKVLVDISNPLDFSKGMPPTLSVCNTDSTGEQIQRAFPAVKVVKTLNTLNAYLMATTLSL